MTDVPGRTLSLSTSKIIARVDGSTGWLTFNQPEKRNAISLEMWEAVRTAAVTFAEDDEVRVVVLHGAGGKAFASGADISEFAASRSSAEAETHYGAVSKGARTALETMGKPIIAMIQGFCIGGGAATALLADLRIATPDSRFGIPAARLGLAYGVASLRRLVALVGPAAAKDIIFTGRHLDAAEALTLGLINRIVEADALEAEVTALARMIAANAPLTIRHARAAIDMIAGDPADRDPAEIDELHRACFDSDDYREGRTAFTEKRRPVFRGR